MSSNSEHSITKREPLLIIQFISIFHCNPQCLESDQQDLKSAHAFCFYLAVHLRDRWPTFAYRALELPCYESQPFSLWGLLSASTTKASPHTGIIRIRGVQKLRWSKYEALFWAHFQISSTTANYSSEFSHHYLQLAPYCPTNIVPSIPKQVGTPSLENRIEK